MKMYTIGLLLLCGIVHADPCSNYRTTLVAQSPSGDVTLSGFMVNYYADLATGRTIFLYFTPPTSATYYLQSDSVNAVFDYRHCKAVVTYNADAIFHNGLEQ